MSQPPGGLERRLVLRILGHWRAKREGDEIPSLDAVTTAELDDAWSNVFVLRMSAAGVPVVGRVGALFLEDTGGHLIGKTIDAVPPSTLMSEAMRYWPDVIEKKVPITMGGEFTNPSGVRILYRSIVLPLSDDGVTVDFLLGAASCRVA